MLQSGAHPCDQPAAPGPREPALHQGPGHAAVRLGHHRRGAHPGFIIEADDFGPNQIHSSVKYCKNKKRIFRSSNRSSRSSNLFLSVSL